MVNKRHVLSLYIQIYNSQTKKKNRHDHLDTRIPEYAHRYMDGLTGWKHLKSKKTRSRCEARSKSFSKTMKVHVQNVLSNYVDPIRYNKSSILSQSRFESNFTVGYQTKIPLSSVTKREKN